MNKLHWAIVAFGTGVCAAGPADAKPIQIRWSVTQPTAVTVDTMTPLQYKDRAFEGQVPEGKHTVVIGYQIQYNRFYGDVFNQPFKILVTNSMPSVNFEITHLPQKYCTEALVERVESTSTTPQDAVNRFVAAGQLLDIPRNPGGCDPELRARAIRARHDQNVAMWKLDPGLFEPDDMFSAELKVADRELQQTYKVSKKAGATR